MSNCPHCGESWATHTTACRHIDSRMLNTPKPLTIPPPNRAVEALRNFVVSIEEYERTGVWPDNGTLRRLADEGREALDGCDSGT